ncbi:hypothetical protein V490_03982 [Pseudogymnoascus sp. VKM F-3557]|nr:hypothetical protein V490_03982 [Pseudogymnoascus sp. VKM F-3557]
MHGECKNDFVLHRRICGDYFGTGITVFSVLTGGVNFSHGSWPGCGGRLDWSTRGSPVWSTGRGVFLGIRKGFGHTLKWAKRPGRIQGRRSALKKPRWEPPSPSASEKGLWDSPKTHGELSSKLTVGAGLSRQKVLAAGPAKPRTNSGSTYGLPRIDFGSADIRPPSEGIPIQLRDPHGRPCGLPRRWITAAAPPALLQKHFHTMPTLCGAGGVPFTKGDDTVEITQRPRVRFANASPAAALFSISRRAESQ